MGRSLFLSMLLLMIIGSPAYATLCARPSPVLVAECTRAGCDNAVQVGYDAGGNGCAVRIVLSEPDLDALKAFVIASPGLTDEKRLVFFAHRKFCEPYRPAMHRIEAGVAYVTRDAMYCRFQLSTVFAGNGIGKEDVLARRMRLPAYDGESYAGYVQKLKMQERLDYWRMVFYTYLWPLLVLPAVIIASFILVKRARHSSLRPIFKFFVIVSVALLHLVILAASFLQPSGGSNRVNAVPMLLLLSLYVGLFLIFAAKRIRAFLSAPGQTKR